MARTNVMERRHYGNLAQACNMVLLNTPEKDRPEAIVVLTALAVAIASINENMNMSEFLDEAGIPHSTTNADTGSGRPSRGGVEGLAAHKRL